MINSYPSIYNLGHKAITDLFKQEVIVEEKVDGSQFSFMRKEGRLFFRSKGKEIHAEAPEKMFAAAVKTVQEIDHGLGLPEGLIFRGEYLSKPKHNTLAYERHPTQHIIIFDIDDGQQNFLPYQDKVGMATTYGFEVVPLLFEGLVTEPDQLRSFLEKVSVLGGQKIEGMVIKPKGYDLFGRDKNVLMGKFVSEAFKEIHGVEWKSKKTPGTNDIINILTANYATEPRWNKAVQHLRDAGTLEDAPQDIGKLMAEVPADVQKECEEEIREKLWKWAWPQLRRTLTRGLPEWYKQQLLNKQFEGTDDGPMARASVDDGPMTTPQDPVPVLAEPMGSQSLKEQHPTDEARESTKPPRHDALGVDSPAGPIFPYGSEGQYEDGLIAELKVACDQQDQ